MSYVVAVEKVGALDYRQRAIDFDAGLYDVPAFADNHQDTAS